MTDQDKRAVEGLARCGISLQGLYDAFPRFPAEEIRKIYGKVHKTDEIQG
jgi:hypothetical protein